MLRHKSPGRAEDVIAPLGKVERRRLCHCVYTGHERVGIGEPGCQIILLAEPESLGGDVLESGLYLLRERCAGRAA